MIVVRVAIALVMLYLIVALIAARTPRYDFKPVAPDASLPVSVEPEEGIPFPGDYADRTSVTSVPAPNSTQPSAKVPDDGLPCDPAGGDCKDDLEACYYGEYKDLETITVEECEDAIFDFEDEITDLLDIGE